MLDPKELHVLAVSLWNAPNPTDAELRRAVSTVYYAVFHTIAQAAADLFVGSHMRNAAAYAVLYRSFDHGHMARTCRDLQSQTLAAKYQRILGLLRLSDETRGFARGFPRLQQERHLADYDPNREFDPSNVLGLIKEAEFVLENFWKIADDEKRAVLALMMVRIRE